MACEPRSSNLAQLGIEAHELIDRYVRRLPNGKVRRSLEHMPAEDALRVARRLLAALEVRNAGIEDLLGGRAPAYPPGSSIVGDAERVACRGSRQVEIGGRLIDRVR
jgi:hypothetical protein